MCNKCISKKNAKTDKTGIKKYIRRYRTNEDKILKSIGDYINKEIGIFEDNLICLIREFTDINERKGIMCGCKKTIIIENSPDCFKVGSGLFCKNCYFVCPCCEDIYNKEDPSINYPTSPELSANFNDLTDALISACDCEKSKYHKHLEKYGEFLVCDDCIDEEREGCSCGCGEFIFCIDCQETAGCNDCDKRYLQYCTDGEVYWCGNCEEESCCRRYYKVKTDNGIDIRCSNCITEI